MHANLFFSVSEGMINSAAHARDCLTVREKCTFLAGNWAGCPRDLRNFWEEQLTVAQICTNSGLSNLAREICANPTGSVGRQDCAILDPNRLLKRIVQFLEGRLGSLQNCTISWGSYSACSWIKSG